MAIPKRGRLEGRGAAAVLLILFVAGGAVFVFAGTLARANELETEAAAARADVSMLNDRVESGLEEIAFIETDTFTNQAARGVGYGEQGEQLFALPPDAPSPAPLPALRAEARDSADLPPLEAWLELLFET